MHYRVAGRVRISLTGLYRSPSTKRRLEESICSLEPVSQVRASLLTGTALILYDKTMPTKQFLSQLETALMHSFEDFSGNIDQVAKEKPAPRSSSSHPGRGLIRKRDQKIEAWHTHTSSAILDMLQSDSAQGLSRNEANQRMIHYGPNALVGTSSRSGLEIFLGQFKSLPVAMLGVSAAIAVATGGLADAGVILGVVLLNATIGYLTEAQAEKTIADLGRMGPSYAQILRGGKRYSLSVEEIVPGDIIHLSPGSQVAADARLLSDHRLTVDESALTGESMPVRKRSGASLSKEAMLGDRVNMVYMGTLATGGDGVGVVVNTGNATELGQIQALVDSTRPPQTPMETQLDTLSTQLGILSAVTCAGVFALGVIRHQPWLLMLNSAMSLAVAAVPEGLPAVATTTLALGIHKLKYHKVAVRKLDAVESLGSLQALCLDKTGTLTTNHMTVVAAHCDGCDFEVKEGRLYDQQEIIPAREAVTLMRLAEILTLCNEVELNGEDSDTPLYGSPTEVALVEFALANGIDFNHLRRQYFRVLSKERSEGRPWMMSKHRTGSGDYLIAVKGSPTELLSRSDFWLDQGHVERLDDLHREAILKANERMAAQALRVLGVAYRMAGSTTDNQTRELIWVGLVGMQDPLRQGMPELMERFHRAGIKTAMITGDQSTTAYAIARQLKLNENGAIEILDSAHLDQVEPELLAGLVKRVDVFSRVSPAHKLRIVQALQQSGCTVAMTGDGINDGPALKSADIGIAMGSGGTDVARSVSDMVIEDDNLHTMAEAIRQGRGIYADIRKSVHYLLSTNFSEIEVMFSGVAVGLGQVLNPMQLLWINLVTDVFPALALSLEPPEEEVMSQAPRPVNEPIITRQKLKNMALESAAITGGALSSYMIGRARGGPQLASTLAFHSLTLAQLMHATACRSDRYGLFNPPVDRAPNHWLELALGLTVLLHLTTLLVPGVRHLLGTAPIRPLDIGVLLAGAAGPLVINESLKALRDHTPVREENPS
ncbi:MAG: hypothetical protein B6D77_03640 [gamma proteobacterium symbiont of Ctena orbiculata]|nr:MAG: hypothetical protein B6D77_03640 [gamma proteobacterium symbiont of Ctena orbiculata]PVV17635.1 MAG: hypothetical protein B6D78_18285 [gamma proteobacterium symbiont of Ctena orbiculata]